MYSEAATWNGWVAEEQTREAWMELLALDARQTESKPGVVSGSTSGSADGRAALTLPPATPQEAPGRAATSYYTYAGVVS